jgi:hypothetical protein
MNEDDFYQDYQAQHLEFVHRYQSECWATWFNHFLLLGMPVKQAEEKTKAIVEDWTGSPMNYNPFISEDNLDF